MAVSERAKRSLRELGLTTYESTAYQFLLLSGPTAASQISSATGLPYSKIYDVLTGLERKGWVEVESGRPKRYYPTPPSEALEATRLRVEQALAENVGQLLDELQPLYSRKAVQERPDIWILRGEFNILARIREMLGETERELMIAATMLPRAFSEVLMPELLRLQRWNTAMRFLVARDVVQDGLMTLHGLGTIRLKEHMFGNGIISDGRRVMLLVGTGRDSTYLAISSDHLGLVGLAKEYFDYLWADAEAI
jgi:sugar-specific transcriptional regulator TrmB